MELFGSSIKKYLIFLDMEPCTFRGPSFKNEKNPPQKKFLVFQGMKLSISKIF